MKIKQLLFLLILTLMVFSFPAHSKQAEEFSVVESEDGMMYEFVEVNGITLHVAVSGEQGGEPVILLHGYPDASFGWRYQMVALAEKGFFVIAPDQRGYNLSEKPRGKENYMMEILASDIIALADEFGFEQFNLAGHDFGGIVSWNLVDFYSERVRRLMIFNAPHPHIIQEFYKENVEQRKKSWYAYFFQIPVLPELLIRFGNWKLPSSAMEESFTEEELDEYRQAWSQPGANTAMINWYRAMFAQKDEDRPKSIIDVPTLVVWGKQDPHIMWQMAAPSAEMCSDSRVEYIEDATHWVLKDAPEETSELLVDFFE